VAQLGFTLTEAQKTVLREMRKDLGAGHPMRRLLQGDVGSGKTVVAAVTALMALESGFNVALMAPTEILAEQHYAQFERWFRPLGLRVALETGHAARGEGIVPGTVGAAGLEADSATLVIGTHALIEPAFACPNLGLVIIDEQHKFGVAQREALLRKGRYPHLLVMTATPIPRTLGLTVYGDLDISVIRELPAGRGRVRTFVRGPAQLARVHEFIRQKIAEGRQAYVVYPRVEDADLKTGLKAVQQEFERLSKEYAPHPVGMLHGRVRPEERDEVMAAFRAGRVKMLLATSVIEVGVDVPNASVMVIENAEQFGLAQLHQLRGRIGRGAHESYCVLMVNRENPEARRRLRVLEETNDGFRIAEADLEFRGPGDFLGQEQSGLPPFRFADLVKDRGLIEWARLLARHLAQ
jgi:ATP-dependent DNA helicase RecG